MESIILLFLILLQVIFNTSYFLHSRITNASDAEPGEFLFIVSIHWSIPPSQDYTHSFAGVVINKFWILTAGHCIKTILQIGTIRLKIAIYDIREDNVLSQNIKISKKIVHEDFDGNEMINDIGLIKLNKPLTFSNRLTFVKLPQSGTIPTGTAIIIGWGSTSSSLNLANYLQQASVPILSNTKCKHKLNGYQVNPAQFCTGSSRGIISACHGDSGGPLLQYRNKTIELIGIISWGLLPCGRVGAITVYTRVSHFIEWINRIILQN